MLTYKTLLKTSFTALCLLLLCGTTSFAQKKEKIKMKPTEGKVSSSVRGQAYYYPQFQKGKVKFISGVTSSGTLNYNMLTGEVEFINPDKDTLALDNMYTVSMITIGTDTFYYDTDSNYLLKLVDEVKGKKLLVKEKYSLSNVKNVGAMGMESNTVSPTSTTNTDFRNTQNKLKPNESLTYSAKTYYYLGTESEYMPVTKANIVKLFPAHSETLKEYMKENKLTLNNEEEIKKVFQYASSL
jgi:hypothetical protein